MTFIETMYRITNKKQQYFVRINKKITISMCKFTIKYDNDFIEIYNNSSLFCIYYNKQLLDVKSQKCKK